ncbi:hypothetical protein ABK040_009080 [Willaertia magna]
MIKRFKHLFIIVLISLLITFTLEQQKCGDGICSSPIESCSSCPSDCGKCSSENSPVCEFAYLLSNNKSIPLSSILSNDPLLNQQWHLQNLGQLSTTVGGKSYKAISGNDINVYNVWNNKRNAGKGVTLAIVDDGVEFVHPDIQCGFQQNELSVDYCSGSTPSIFGSPVLSDDNHGTSCAGVCCARSNNAQCGVGVAFEANIASIRVLGNEYSDSVVALGISHLNNKIDIYSNSYGPSDDGVTVERYPLAIQAIRNGVLKGRGGRGNIYVWASGNGAMYGDHSNWDELSNNIYVICVSASDWTGKRSIYSEFGSNVFINAPSNTFDDSQSGLISNILSTDRLGSKGYYNGNCNPTFGGTSASCPIAAGVLALLLSANPSLTWRDIHHILVLTSTRTDTSNPTWIRNAAGIYHSVYYGFGRINAEKAVNVASTWTNNTVGDYYSLQVTKTTPSLGTSIEISSNSNSPTVITFDEVNSLIIVERIQITLSVETSNRGSLIFAVRSPSGTISILSHGRKNDQGIDINSQYFTSVQFWGETSNGTWSFSIYTNNQGAQKSLLKSVSLSIFGGEIGGPKPIQTSGSSSIIIWFSVPYYVRAAIAVTCLGLFIAVIILVLIVRIIKDKSNQNHEYVMH